MMQPSGHKSGCMGTHINFSGWNFGTSLCKLMFLEAKFEHCEEGFSLNSNKATISQHFAQNRSFQHFNISFFISLSFFLRWKVNEYLLYWHEFAFLLAQRIFISNIPKVGQTNTHLTLTHQRMWTDSVSVLPRSTFEAQKADRHWNRTTLWGTYEMLHFARMRYWIWHVI